MHPLCDRFTAVRVLTFSFWKAPPSKSCQGGRWGCTVDQPEWPSGSCSYANDSTCLQPEEEFTMKT